MVVETSDRATRLAAELPRKWRNRHESLARMSGFKSYFRRCQPSRSLRLSASQAPRSVDIAGQTVISRRDIVRQVGAVCAASAWPRHVLIATYASNARPSAGSPPRTCRWRPRCNVCGGPAAYTVPMPDDYGKTPRWLMRNPAYVRAGSAPRRGGITAIDALTVCNGEQGSP